ISLGSARQLRHAGLVTEDRPTAALGGWVYCQDRHPVAAIDDVQPEGFDEGRLADTWYAADAQPSRVSGVWQERLQERLCCLAMVGTRGFDQGDRARKLPSVSRPNRFGPLARVGVP